MVLNEAKGNAAQNDEIMSQVREEDRAGARKVLECLKKKSLSTPTEVSLRRYGKYEELMFGKEDTDVGSDDPIYGTNLGKAPKANQCRKNWTKEEEAEIASGVDLKLMKQQPNSVVARELLTQSRNTDGAIFREGRSESSLKNKLIRNWKMIQKMKDKQD